MYCQWCTSLRICCKKRQNYHKRPCIGLHNYFQLDRDCSAPSRLLRWACLYIAPQGLRIRVRLWTSVDTSRVDSLMQFNRERTSTEHFALYRELALSCLRKEEKHVEAGHVRGAVSFRFDSVISLLIRVSHDTYHFPPSFYTVDSFRFFPLTATAPQIFFFSHFSIINQPFLLTVRQFHNHLTLLSLCHWPLQSYRSTSRSSKHQYK